MTEMQKEVYRAFVRDVGFLHHQIEGFNEFASHRLPNHFAGTAVTIEKTENDVIIERPTGKKARTYHVGSTTDSFGMNDAPGLTPNSNASGASARRKMSPGTYRVKITTKDFRLEDYPRDSETGKAIFPADCLGIKGKHYFVRLTCTLAVDTECSGRDEFVETDRTEIEGHTVMELPVMLRSRWCALTHFANTPETVARRNACPMDLGGYFVINGSERFIVSQEKLLPNRLMRNYTEKDGWTVTMQVRREGETHYQASMELRLSPTDECVYWTSERTLLRDVPVNYLIRALAPDDETAARAMRMEDIDPRVARVLTSTLDQFDAPGLTRQTCLDYIAKTLTRAQITGLVITKRAETARKYLEASVLGERKFETLIHMLRELLHCAAGERRADSRDHVKNKAVASVTTLLSELTAKLASRWRAEAGRELNEIKFRAGKRMRDVVNHVARAFSHKRISPAIFSAIGNGNWIHQKGATTDASSGVTEAVSRYSYLSYLSPLRKVKGDAKSRNADMRQLDSTQFGYFCPSETPEGIEAGVVKYLASTATVSSARVGLASLIIRTIGEGRMGTVVLHVTMSLDGFIAGPGVLR